MNSAFDYVKNVLNWENKDTEESLKISRVFLNERVPIEKQRTVMCKFYLIQNDFLEENKDNFLDEVQEYLMTRDLPSFFPPKWFLDPDYKWIIYSLFKVLLETANLEVYFSLIVIFQTLNEEKIRGSHSQLITEHSYEEYPPIADFFRACSGNLVYGKYKNEIKFTRIRVERETINWLRNIYAYHKKRVNLIEKRRITLISTELPELIQEYLDFDIREDVRFVLDKFPDVWIDILNYLGYTVNIRSGEGGDRNIIVDYIEDEEFKEENIFASNRMWGHNRPRDFESETDESDEWPEIEDWYPLESDDSYCLDPRWFKYQLKEYLKSGTRKLRLCLVSNIKTSEFSEDKDDGKTKIYWSNEMCIIKNPILDSNEFISYRNLEQHELERRDIPYETDYDKLFGYNWSDSDSDSD